MQPRLLNKMELLSKRIELFKKISKIMLTNKNLTIRFCAYIMNKACYILNYCFLRFGFCQSIFEFFHNKKPNVKHQMVFLEAIVTFSGIERT